MLYPSLSWAQLPDLASGPSETVTTPTDVKRPNIVFIYTDDLGYGDIGAFGADDIKTPHIDSLAIDGAKFTQFYNVAPVCTPARAGLLTGRYPIRMGIHHVFFQSSYTGMPENELTLAEHLKPAGYATGIIGKWHLGHHEKYLPLNQGFDEFFGIPYSNDMSPLPMMRGNDYIEPHIDQTRLTKRLTQEAVNFINAKSGQPFFLYLAHPMPHVPLFRSEAFENVSDRGAYGDVIQELDWSVGEVLAALEDNDLTNNTLVVFSSDNGPWLFMGKDGGSAGPLRNGKGTTFEGGVRTPLLARLPGTIAPGLVIETPASMVDWFPTLSAMAGAETPPASKIDGQDLAPLWRGDTLPVKDRTIAFYSHGKLEAIRKGPWKLKQPYDSDTIPIPAPVRFFLKGEVGLKSHSTLLFNLDEDPGETRNLAGKHPEQVKRLRAELTNFETRIGDVPPSLTDAELKIEAPMMILLGAAAKAVFLILAFLFVLFGLLFFWLGRRSGRKKYSQSLD